MAEIETEKKAFDYAIGMDATILKTQITGLLKGGDGETEILILPKEVETIQVLNIKELIDAVKVQFNISEKEITDRMDGIKNIFKKFKPDELSFQLNQIFFYYKKKNEEGQDASPATIEYAFSIKINLGGLLNLADIISIETLYLAIWNTGRGSVLKQFNMADIKALLPE